jgi:putative spermidine/putrescine transport system permease protein
MIAQPNAHRSWRPYLLVLLPSLFLLVFFVIPNAFLLAASFLKSDAQVLTDEFSLEAYGFLFTRPLYQRAIVRTFVVGASVGLLVVVLSYPLALFLARTTSRWKGLLMGLSLAPLLASVIVRTYGWWVLLNREGAISDLLRWLGLADAPVVMLPSVGAIILGLSHSLLPFGVLSILSALNGINPNMERAALSLGASRTRTFLSVTLPLSMTGVVAGFLLAFSLSISAYATPTILGGPATETMATLVYKFMVSLMDWSIGSALGTLLILSSLALILLGTLLGARRSAL